MKKRVFTTFIAHNMTVEQLQKFHKLFSELESTTGTITCITWSGTSPRLCTIAIHAGEDNYNLLLASFKDGLLNHNGWSEHFTLLPEKTSEEMITSPDLAEPSWPGEEKLAELRATT